MARVEVLTGREFNRTVPVSVIPRDEFRARGENRSENATFAAWNNQVWEALFIVGEDRNVQDELGSVSVEQTAGFYSVEADEIKIVTDSPEMPVIDNATLVHELVHALQDQRHNLSRPSLRAKTQDGQLAADAIVEGEANHVQYRYSSRCGADWSCVATPASASTGGGSDLNLGVFLTVIYPYSDGPVYVDGLLASGGPSAVDAAFDTPPKSTEQVTHATEQPPIPISFEDTARGGWAPFPDQGVNGSDTVGEASIFAMLWYQAYEYGANTIPVRSIGDTDGEFDLYNYVASASAGWGNDRLFPYARDGETDTEYGYVWITEWDSTADAREFSATYREILSAQGAALVDDGTWVIRDGPFADAFRVDRRETRVTGVNAPEVEDLDELRPGLSTSPATPVQSPSVTTPSSNPGVETPEGQTNAPQTQVPPPVTTPGQPGLGVAAAVLALLMVAVGRLLTRRSG